MSDDKKKRPEPLKVSQESYDQRRSVWTPDMMGTEPSIVNFSRVGNPESVPSTTEANTIICKVCLLPKLRIEAGKFPGKGNIKKYVDQFGKAFNGKTCPDCNKSRMKNVMRAGRLGKIPTDP